MRRLLQLILLLILVGLLAATWAWQAYRGFLQQPLAVSEPQVFELARGSSYSRMVDELRSRGLTEDRWQWRLLGALSPDVKRLQAGEYRLEPGITPGVLLARMVAGDVIEYSFTIVEGWTFRQMRMRLAEHPAVRLTLAELDGKELMAELGRPGEPPEGWFLPETYLFPRGTSDREILRRAHRAMEEALAQAWEKRLPGLPLASPYEVLVLGSIIEKETAVPEERREIAGVFVRRLMRNMRLQTDPTVIYGLGPEFDGDIRYRDLRSDTPYNTYTRHGLPPTPIALPGRDSLNAAVDPAPGDALYFVSRGDGTHVFSATLEEHEAAVDRYQRKP